MTITTVRKATAHACLVMPVSEPAFAHSFRAKKWTRRVAIYSCAIVGLGALQLFSAGTPAIATVSMNRPMAQVTRVARMPAIQTALVPDADPSLIAALFEDVFPAFRFNLNLAFKPALEPVAEPENPDELIDFGNKRAPRWLVDTILKAAQVTGVDPVYLMTLADVESSLEPKAKASTSSAEGLFQFIDGTWLEILRDHGADYGYASAAAAIKIVNDDYVIEDGQRGWILGLKRDPYLSALMAGELINDIQRELRDQGERELAEAELYLAHFFGAKTAIEFLKVLDNSPNAIAARLFPKAARANSGLFTQRAGRKRRSITVAELYDRIDSKIVRRLNQYDMLARGTTDPVHVANALAFAP